MKMQGLLNGRFGVCVYNRQGALEGCNWRFYKSKKKSRSLGHTGGSLYRSRAGGGADRLSPRITSLALRSGRNCSVGI